MDTEEKLTRSEAVFLAVLLKLWCFWCWLTTPGPWPKEGSRLEAVVCWSLIAVIAALLYLWSSFECAMGRECLIANADLANALFGK